MRRLWLLFAQTVTIALALYFVYTAVQRPAVLPKPVPTAAHTAILADASAPPSPGSYRAAASRAMPAVVNILTTKAVRKRHPLSRDPFFKRFFGDRDEEDDQNSLGSGVIVSPQGYILTNYHVVEAADEIQVVLPDGRKAAAKMVGTDPETDLAVVRIELDKLPVVALGQVEQAKVGDVVLAIGNPFGVGQTVTMGIISALGRNNLHINHFENFIQTDAAINFGNSGGALIDTQGNLLGINSAIYSQTGVRSASASRSRSARHVRCSMPSSRMATWCAAGSASNRRKSRRNWRTASAWRAIRAPSSPAWYATDRPTRPA